MLLLPDDEAWVAILTGAGDEFNPKGQSSTPWPWGNVTSPPGNQAKLVFGKRHGLTSGYLQEKGSQKPHKKTLDKFSAME
jgi:hypothetical protein